MNYIKKIKSLGFKKVEPVVVCTIREIRDKKRLFGLKLKKLREIEKDIEKNLITGVEYPIVSSQYVSRISSYVLKLSDEVSIYLILLGNEFTLVVSDDRVDDYIDDWSIHLNQIRVPIKSEQLSNDFWKKCLSAMDKGIQREILLRIFLK